MLRSVLVNESRRGLYHWIPSVVEFAPGPFTIVTLTQSGLELLFDVYISVCYASIKSRAVFEISLDRTLMCLYF